MLDKDSFFRRSELKFNRLTQLNLRGEIVTFDFPKIMGILNLTPDSFYDGGKYSTENHILRQTEKMVSEGATFIDVGAFSSRPGARIISEDEELERLDRPIRLIRKKWPDSYISVDTFRSGVAKRMVRNYNVDLVNDISGGEMDSNMYQTIYDLGIPYIFMHMKGTPSNMQEKPEYENVVEEVLKNLSEKLHQLNSMGIKDVIADPGFGFGKTLDHNYSILAHLDAFQILGVPLLVGVSRKSMIYNLLNTSTEEVLNGTTILHTLAVLKGAGILRVHDVKEAFEVVQIYKKLREVSSTNKNSS